MIGPLGFSGTTANTALQNDGIFAGDGIPADVIRNSWDEPWDGNPGSEPVYSKLMSGINGSISSLLGSLGSASTPSTNYVSQVTNEGEIVNEKIGNLMMMGMRTLHLYVFKLLLILASRQTNLI